MEYQVELSDEAEAELDAAYLFLLQRSPDAAFRWYIGARAAINSLSELPRRCPLARENASYPDNEVRQLLYGTGAVLTAFCLWFSMTMQRSASCSSVTGRGC